MKDKMNIPSFNPPIASRVDGGKLTSEQVMQLLKTTCHYVDYVVFTQNSKEQLVALIFPDKNQLLHPDYQKTPEEGCFCPRNLEEVGKCLTGCLKKANTDLTKQNTPISLAIIVGEKYTAEKGKLTDLGVEKIKNIIDQYKTQPVIDDVYVIDLEK